MTPLVIVAHQDDETLGCGGAAAGGRWKAWYCTDGVGSRGQGLEQAALARQRHYRNACAVLGMQANVTHTDLPDNELDTVSRLTLARAVEQLCERDRPEAIYTHHVGDLNVDHRRVAEAVLAATRPGGRYPVNDIYAMEIPSSTEWGFGQIEPRFTPNVFVNITETIEHKLQAFSCYEDEVRPSPHPRSLEMIRARARYWGSVAGYPYAEAFQLIRSLR